MRKEIVQTGTTVDEAINSACMRLGVKLEDCQFEILDLPKTSFFGLKKVPAKVKVWIEVPDELVEEPEVEEEIVVEIPKKRKPVAPLATTLPNQIVTLAEEPQVATVLGSLSQKKEETQPQQQREQPRVVNYHDPEPVRELDVLDLEKIELAKDYVGTLVTGMGVEGEIGHRPENGGVCITVTGGRLGTLIGRRGETLNAIQYLTGLVGNRLEGEYLRISVDAGDYRLKRNESLEEMAKKAAEQVLRTNVSRSLEAMNPAERRVIHSAIAGIEGVSSSSVGVEPHRRVVVKTPTSKMRTESRPTGGNRPPKGRGPRDNRNRSGSKERDTGSNHQKNPPTEVVLPSSTPESSADTPLYGKIDLD